MGVSVEEVVMMGCKLHDIRRVCDKEGVMMGLEGRVLETAFV